MHSRFSAAYGATLSVAPVQACRYARHSSATSVSRRYNAKPSMRLRITQYAESEIPASTSKISVAIQKFP